MNTFWMVFVEGKQGYKMVHLYKVDAIDECERLLRLPDNLGRKVYLMESVQVCSIEQQPVKWESLGEE